MSGAVEKAVGLGPVSEFLADELRDEARRHGVLVWLDKSALYTDFVDALAARGDAAGLPVLAFRGSFLELLLALDGHADGVTAPPLLVHMPGFTEEDIKQTPVYELYRAGRRFRKGLDTLIEQAAAGRVVPADIAAAKASLGSLAEADAWLAAKLRGEGDELALPMPAPAQFFDDLVQRGPLAQRLGEAAVRHAVLRHLERTLGLDAAWRDDVDPMRLALPRELQLLVTSWVLCVEFVHDLKRAPRDAMLAPLRKLPAALVTASCALAEHIRTAHADDYERDADQVEADLVAERDHAVAEDLGRIDTLRFEDQKVFDAALTALEGRQWGRAVQFAGDRTADRSFWVRRDPARRTGWHLVDLAARLGAACDRHQELLTGVRDLDEAADRYASGGWEVDQAQRHLEQARRKLPLIRLAEFPALRRCLDEARRAYREWADRLAIAFNALCRQQGFLPVAARRQRELFDDVVRPAAEKGGPVAYFVVDALRFEMGVQLAAWMDSETGARVKVGARYAELPTLTEVGMNVLAPVSRDGRLRPEMSGLTIKGFRAGATRVNTPALRQKAMQERVGGETCPWLPLEKLLERDVASLRRTVKRARLVVVHAEGLDKAGEKGVGLGHFEDELQRLRAAWFRLRDAGVKSFVVTADHGFLIQDDTTRVPFRRGKLTDPKRRHAIVDEAADRAGEVRVSAAELGYDDAPWQMVFPESSQPYDTGARTKEFLHGGNSLQERLIPVLVASYRDETGGSTLAYSIEAEGKTGVMGLHRIAGKVGYENQMGLGYAESEEVELRLVALDEDDVAVELVEAPEGRVAAGALVVRVDRTFEVLFRVTGPRPARVRIQVASALGMVAVTPLVLERRFAVEVIGPPEPAVEPATEAEQAAAAAEGWLAELPEGPVREVFRHIQTFGAINEDDATRLLGGPRLFRKFSRAFEGWAARAPFVIRIDASSGQKRYVKEGGS